MPIQASEIKIYKSLSGVSLGGAITATEIVSGVLNNLFDNVTSAEALNGDTEYRCIYVKNTNPTIDLTNAKVFISADTASPDTSFEIGLGTSGKNTVEQTIPSEGSVPVGIVFSAPTTAATGLDIGVLEKNGGYFPIWLKRKINANASAASADTVSIAIFGETSV